MINKALAGDILKKKGWLILMLFLLVDLLVVAQPGRRVQRMFDEARQLYGMQDYAGAIDRSERILRLDSSFVDAHLLLADIFSEQKSLHNEIFHLEKAMKNSEIPLILRRLGEASFLQEQYGKALDYFQKYVERAKLKPDQLQEMERRMENCRFAINAIQNPVDFHPERLPPTVNSTFDEYWPSLSIDQQQLIFTRLIKLPGQQPQEDFYLSVYGPDGWEKATPVTEINTLENEGAQSLSADGNILFFTACNRPGGYGSCDIYYSVRRNGKWNVPVNAGAPLNSAYWEAQPSFSSDGRFLYFASNRPGGRGGRDIWRAEVLDIEPNGRIKWAKPENLGDSINTPGNETSPFIHPGNRDFYFASDYHTGMGGYDLFLSRLINDSVFSRPRNLGYPVNTVNDEQGLHISADGLTAFFSSARDTVTGLDIYSFKVDESIRPHPATYVRAFVSDAETRERVQARIDLLNLAQPDEKPRTEITDSKGEILVCLPAGNDYSFSVSKEGYLFYSNSFNLSVPRQIYNPYDLDILLTPVKEGAEMNLYNIYFETDSFRILPESEPELQKLVDFLKDNSRLEVEIQGHTDDTGTAERNLELSQKRAQSVVEFLVLHGIKKERLEWTGYGQDRPVAENNTEEGRRLNRRTTIKILGNGG
jgi:outer membrane protein OmpA-like peptidoglycan-associated protein/Tol biopolymer transport system component